MRKLFWADLFIIILLISCTTSFSDKEIIQEGYSLSGVEAQEYYSIYKDYSPRILYNLAYSYLESNDIDSALACAIEGTEKYPEYLRFYQLMAYCYQEKGETKIYQETLKTIISINPGSKEMRELLIESYLDEEDEENTIKEAKSLLIIDNKNIIALNALALYIPFFQELTGYTSFEKEVTNAMEKIREIKLLDIEPKLNELRALSSN